MKKKAEKKRISRDLVFAAKEAHRRAYAEQAMDCAETITSVASSVALLVQRNEFRYDTLAKTCALNLKN